MCVCVCVLHARCAHEVWLRVEPVLSGTRCCCQLRNGKPVEARPPRVVGRKAALIRTTTRTPSLGFCHQSWKLRHTCGATLDATFVLDCAASAERTARRSCSLGPPGERLAGGARPAPGSAGPALPASQPARRQGPRHPRGQDAGGPGSQTASESFACVLNVEFTCARQSLL